MKGQIVIIWIHPRRSVNIVVIPAGSCQDLPPDQSWFNWFYLMVTAGVFYYYRSWKCFNDHTRIDHWRAAWQTTSWEESTPNAVLISQQCHQCQSNFVFYMKCVHTPGRVRACIVSCEPLVCGLVIWIPLLLTMKTIYSKYTEWLLLKKCWW